MPEPVPTHTDVSEAFEDQSSQHLPCQPVFHRVTGSASTCHSSSQGIKFVFEQGREYYVPTSTRKKRKTKHLGNGTSPTDHRSRPSARDPPSKARSTMKAYETVPQELTRSIHVTASTVGPSAIGSRSDSRLTVDHHGRPVCPFLKDINISMDGKPFSSSSSTIPDPAMPVNSPVAIEGMSHDLTHPTSVNQGTSDLIESVDTNTTFLTHPSTTTMNKANFHSPGQAPISNFQNQGDIAGHFISATAGDDAPTRASDTTEESNTQRPVGTALVSP
ncbi:hypothetical protein BD410DRAFT_589093 [Rickenella mellea]|uniref:Uncharacterized protein n=1 Tax=Rickenella mellea TaxID=50990 RepID=A0A4Y7PP18_9AGAM|nr:hypothetical protein BD410DRAFT_589093 [Rickenella mellea]